MPGSWLIDGAKAMNPPVRPELVMDVLDTSEEYRTLGIQAIMDDVDEDQTINHNGSTSISNNRVSGRTQKT